MKLTALLLITTFFGLHANDSYGQKTKVTLEVENATVLDIINTIESTTDFRFIYKKRHVDLERRVSLLFKEVYITTVLNDLFKGTDTGFRVRDPHIILRKNKTSDTQRGTTIKPDTNIQMQETFLVEGQVTDSKGVPLAGANIVEKGTTNGTQTDFDGNFSIEVEDENAVLEVSYIGFATKDVAVGGKKSIDVALLESASGLNEVVVVGYGTTKKSDLTGAIGQVKAEDLVVFPTANVSQAIQGRIAGVQVASSNATPGSAPRITIRGITSPFSASGPLFVVDGFVGAVVPPAEDIASVEVLKDAASSAIYGSRGANGVVLITTKKGTQGKPVVEFNTTYATQSVINELDLLNRNQYEALQFELNPGFIVADNGGAETNWQDELFRTANTTNHQLSVSGGSENVEYFVSGTYFDQNGLIRSSDFDRLSLNSNLKVKISDNFDLRANVLARRTTSNGIISQENTGGVVLQGAVSAAYIFAPDLGIFNEDGSYTTQRAGSGFNNPVAIADERIDENTNDVLQINLGGDWKITDWLTLTATAGYNVRHGFRGRYVPSNLVAGEPGGIARVNNNRNTNILSENYLTFQKEFSDIHRVKFVGGVSYQETEQFRSEVGAEQFLSDATTYNNLSTGQVVRIPESFYDVPRKLFSTYGRFEYSYDSRYVVNGTVRYDGSSVLSQDNKYKLYPSVGLAWNVGNESFLENVAALNVFKFRASLGQTGNQNVPRGSSQATLNSTFYSDENNNPVVALTPGQIPNSDLGWETTEQLNFGIDLGLWNDKFTLTAEYYKSNTTDLLFDVPLNPIVGGSARQRRNLGEIENRGFELTIGTNQNFGKFNWSSNLNISRNRNEVVSLPDDEDIFYSAVPDHINGLSNSSQNLLLREGQPIGVFWGFIYDGVYQEGDDFLPGSGFEQEAGGERFRDTAGRDADGEIVFTPDGELNSDDRQIIGDPNPDFIFGFNNDFQYKGFDMNVFFQGSQGGDIMNFTLLELEDVSGGGNQTTAVLNRWIPSNTNTNVPKAAAGRNARISTRFLEDGSFIRLKNVSLGYSLPKKVLDDLGLKKFRFFISGQNLWTITDYKGVDPEVSYRSENNRSRNLGLDYGSYPNVKSYNLGLNLSF